MAIGDKFPVVMDPNGKVKDTPVEADSVLLYDSQDSGKPKKALLAKLTELFKETFYPRYDVDLLLRRKSNPNLLDNWYFADPIDQRRGWIVKSGTPYYSLTDGTQAGTTDQYYKLDSWAGTVGASNGFITINSVRYLVPAEAFAVRGYVGVGYTIDMWYNEGLTLEIRDGCIRLSSDGRMVNLRQSLDGSYKDSTLTFSVTVRGLCEIVIGADNTYPISAYSQNTGAWELVSFSYHVKTDSPIKLYIKERGPCDVAAAKLELGDQQTLAYQDENGNWVLNDPPPNKALELAKCQQYCVVLHSEVAGGALANGVYMEGPQARVIVPCNIRTKPVLLTEGKFFLAGETAIPVASMLIGTKADNAIMLICNVGDTAPKTAGHACYLRGGDTNSRIIISAEL